MIPKTNKINNLLKNNIILSVKMQLQFFLFFFIKIKQHKYLKIPRDNIEVQASM